MKSHHRGAQMAGSLPIIADTVMLSELLEKAGPRLTVAERFQCAELAARLELGGAPLSKKERDAVIAISKAYGTLPKTKPRNGMVGLRAAEDCYSERPCEFAEQHLAKHSRREDGAMLVPPGRSR